MKWIGLALIFIGCTAVGFLMDCKRRLEVKEIGKLIYAFELLKREIDYGLTPIGEACDCVVNSVSSEGIKGIFKRFQVQLAQREFSDINMIWRWAVDDNKQQLHLSGEVYEVLYGFGNAVGYLDKEMQKKNIEMVIEQLRHLYQKSRDNLEKGKNLGTILGALGGSCIVIFLF